MQDFPYIDAKAAAQILNWSYQKFQRIAAKEIPHQRFSDLGNRLYKADDVLLYKKTHITANE